MAEYMSSMLLLPMTPGMRVQFEAVSPTDGTIVSGVTIANAALYVTDAVAEGGTAVEIGPYTLVPGPQG